MMIFTRCMIFSRKLSLMLLMLIFAMTTSAIAQSVKVKVSDEKGEALPGVSVLVKGTQTGGITDMNGEVSVPTDKGTTLVLSYIGFLTKEEDVNGRSSIDVSLAEDTKALG
jgi:TonB-dependent starch-binding outer membrane protein SusC